MDARLRLSLGELQSDPWLHGGGSSSEALLATPSVLSARPAARGPVSAEAGVRQTFQAFHRATREGFRLMVSHWTVAFRA